MRLVSKTRQLAGEWEGGRWVDSLPPLCLTFPTHLPYSLPLLLIPNICECPVGEDCQAAERRRSSGRLESAHTPLMGGLRTSKDMPAVGVSGSLMRSLPSVPTSCFSPALWNIWISEKTAKVPRSANNDLSAVLFVRPALPPLMTTPPLRLSLSASSGGSSSSRYLETTRVGAAVALSHLRGPSHPISLSVANKLRRCCFPPTSGHSVMTKHKGETPSFICYHEEMCKYSFVGNNGVGLKLLEYV